MLTHFIQKNSIRMCVHVYLCKSVTVPIMLYTIISMQRQREVGRCEKRIEKKGKIKIFE